MEGEIKIKIRITIKKEILSPATMADEPGVARPSRCSASFPHPEGVTDGSRSVEARRDLRISVRREIAP
jgi:hypothetical protein